MKALGLLRSVVGIFLGLMAITLVTELIEFLLVTASNRGIATEPERYFAIRNQPWILALKVIYNTAAAGVGGYLAAWIAGRAPVAHGRVLALIQAAALVWALSDPEMSRTAPTWLWLTLIVVSVLGILAGAHLFAQRRAARSD